MAKYHFLDESGDPGLSDSVHSSSHFFIAMVELDEHKSLPELAIIRQNLHLSNTFEFKFYNAKPVQKEMFFHLIKNVPFRVRIAVFDKTRLPHKLTNLSGHEFMLLIISGLIMRASEKAISNDTLILDEATPVFIRDLRIQLSQASRNSQRMRPFKKIVSASSHREDGIQLADMVVGATRNYVLGITSSYYKTFENKVVDYWKPSY